MDVCDTIFECRLSTEECKTKQVDTLDRVNVTGDWIAEKVKQDNQEAAWAVVK
jgi:hypothetical protein